MTGDGRVQQAVPRNPMQATQSRAVKPLTSVPAHEFHPTIDWLNVSMAGVSAKFFQGLVGLNQSSVESRSAEEILTIGSKYVTRPFDADEIKTVQKDAAREAWYIRTGERLKLDAPVKIPQAYFPDASVTVSSTEKAVGAKMAGGSEARKVVDAAMDVHRELACPARVAYVLLRDNQERQMDKLRDHVSLLRGGHEGSLELGDIEQILAFSNQCACDADSMFAQLFLIPAMGLRDRVLPPAPVSTKKSKFGTAVPPSLGHATRVDQERMFPSVSHRPAKHAGGRGVYTAPSEGSKGRPPAGRSGLSPSQAKNRKRRLRAKQADTAVPKTPGGDAVTPASKGTTFGTPATASGVGATGGAPHATPVSVPKAGLSVQPKSPGTPKGRGGGRDGRNGAGRGRGRGNGKGRGSARSN